MISRNCSWKQAQSISHSVELSTRWRLGKSWAVRTKAVLLSLNYPGIRILIVRRTYPELINNHVNILRKQLIDVARYNDKDKVLKFDNGSTINFAYCAKDGDLDRLQGVEYDIIFIDEATQLSEYQMRTITACLRGVNDFPKRVYYTCNPGKFCRLTQ